jgi:hypothetical protein
MSARLLNAPLLLLLWQVAPLEVQRTPLGRFRLGLGAGAGMFAFVSRMSCDGRPYTEVRDYHTLGGAAEVWASDRVRMSGAAGMVTDETHERDGAFGAVHGAVEGRHVGAGLGVGSAGGRSRSWHPSASFRLGPLDRLHFRAEYGTPGLAMPVTGLPRVGLGYNQGRQGGKQLFAGLATTPIPEHKQRVGPFLEMSIPLGHSRSNTYLSLFGFVGGIAESHAIGSVSAGLFIQP